MAKRRTAVERAIEQLSAKIDALVCAREALIEQQRGAPAKAKPTPRPAPARVRPVPEDAAS